MRLAAAIFLFIGAVSLRADSFGDMKAAVASLRGAAPIQAALEIERTEIDHAKKPPLTMKGGATVNVRVDAEGLHVAYAPALVARVSKENADRQSNSEALTPTTEAVQKLGPVPIAERLDFGQILLGMLARAAVLSERRVTYEGRPVRLLALKVNTPNPKTSIGHVEILEDSMNLWLGDDNVPVAAQRTERVKGGILFLKVQGTQTSRWAFTRKDDRLVALRTETKNTSSGVGEDQDETEVVTVLLK